MPASSRATSAAVPPVASKTSKWSVWARIAASMRRWSGVISSPSPMIFWPFLIWMTASFTPAAARARRRSVSAMLAVRLGRSARLAMRRAARRRSPGASGRRLPGRLAQRSISARASRTSSTAGATTALGCSEPSFRSRRVRKLPAGPRSSRAPTTGARNPRERTESTARSTSGGARASRRAFQSSSSTSKRRCSKGCRVCARATASTGSGLRLPGAGFAGGSSRPSATRRASKASCTDACTSGTTAGLKSNTGRTPARASWRRRSVSAASGRS